MYIKNYDRPHEKAGEYYLEEGKNRACVFLEQDIEPFINRRQEKGIWTEYTFGREPIEE